MKNREFIFYFPTGKSVKIQISDNSRTTEDTLKNIYTLYNGAINNISISAKIIQEIEKTADQIIYLKKIQK